MKENVYFKMKDFLVRALLLMIVSMVHPVEVKAQPGLTIDNPLVLEGGKDYNLESYKYKSLYCTFTAPSDGVLTLTMTLSDQLSLYSDKTYGTLAEEVLLYNDGVCELAVKSGETYYFGRKFMMNASSMSVKFGLEAEALKLTEVYPAEGSILAATDASVNFRFSRKVVLDEVTVKINQTSTNVEYTMMGNMISFQLNSIMMEMYNNGNLKEGDDVVIALKGVRNATDEKDIIGTDGSCSLTLKAAAKPVVLAESINTPNNGMDVFPSYIMSGEKGMVKLIFDGSLDRTKTPKAVLTYGNREYGDQFYLEDLDVEFLSDKAVGVNVHSKLRRLKDMLPNYTGEALQEISLKVSGIYAADGHPVYSEGKGSLGSFSFSYTYEELKMDIAASYDDLQNSGSIDGLDKLTIWVRGEEYLKYSGVQFTYISGGIEKNVLVKNITKEKDPEGDSGDYYLKVPVPDVNMDADTEVKVAFADLEAMDGLDYSADFTATFTTSGKTLQPLTVLSSNPKEGEKLEVLKAGTKIFISTNHDDKIDAEKGSMTCKIDDVTAGETIRSRGYMTKTENGFEYELSRDYVLFEGHDYKIIFVGKIDQSEDDILGEVSVLIQGLSKPFEYSSVELLEVTPAPATVLSSVADSTIVMKFSGAVNITAETAFVNIGYGQKVPLRRISSNDDKTQWTLVIPESNMTSSDAVYVSVSAKDEKGMVVKGDTGEELNSFFNLVYKTPFNSPDLEMTPKDDSVVESIKEVIIGCPDGITENYGLTEKIEIWDRQRNVVATAKNIEWIIPADKEDDFSYVPVEVKVTFDKEVTEAGSYILHVPAQAFILGSSSVTQISKETIVNYFIEAEASQDYIPTEVVAMVGDNNEVTGFTVKTSGWVTLNDAFDVTKIKVLDQEGKEVGGNKLVDYAEAYEDFNIVLETPISQKGTYSLVIPAELFGDNTWIPGTAEGSCNPDLTYPVVISENGVTVSVNSVVAETATKVTVYTLNGVRVLDNADRAALKTLKKGIYVVNGKKVIIK